MDTIQIEAGSFRDPAGKIFYKDNKVFRVLENEGIKRFKFLKSSGLLNDIIQKEFLIECKEISDGEMSFENFKENKIIEHKKLDYISYPYEWSFEQLKDAAIHHLNFHIYLLKKGATLIDSSAFNIQFNAYKPIFIDLLSIKEYEDGEYWTAHRQFCENFLNPLILKSIKNIDYNNWFKGNLEGITTKDLNSILSFKDKLSYNIFTQVVMLDYFDNKVIKSKNFDVNKINKKKFPKNSFLSMLKNLKNFILNLNIKKDKTTWDDYSKNNTYKNNEEILKKKIVKDFSEKYKFNILADLGCNDGVYSEISLNSGSKFVVGFDYDLNAVNNAFRLSKKNKLNFLPLYFDASNPSSNLGWYQKERKGFLERTEFNGMLSLAFEHHLTIGKNIPLDQVIEWLVSTAPRGLIEFVPKNDETIKKMIILKGDIFPDYNEENFRRILENKSKIISSTKISESGRKIFEYSKI